MKKRFKLIKENCKPKKDYFNDQYGGLYKYLGFDEKGKIIVEFISMSRKPNYKETYTEKEIQEWDLNF